MSDTNEAPSNLILIPLYSEQRAQLLGWLNREQSHILALKCVANCVMIPRFSGTLDCIVNDLEFCERIRTAVRKGTDSAYIELTVEDAQQLIDIGVNNAYADKQRFWDGLMQQLHQALQKRGSA